MVARLVLRRSARISAPSTGSLTPLDPLPPTVVETEGNPACHVILRGANSGPNYEAEHVKKAAEGLKKAGVSTRVMIDW